MNKLLDLIISGVTAERLCDWLCAELSSSNPGMRELPSGEYLSLSATCVSPERENPYYHVVIRGQLRDLTTGKESDIDSLAWLVIRPLLETRQHVVGFAYVYADMLKGWFDELKNRMRLVFNVEEVREDSDSIMLDDYSLVQIPSYGKTNGMFIEQDSSIEKIGGQMKQPQGTNLEIAITINTNIHRFEAWLDRYRMETTPFIIELEDGKALSVYSAPTLRSEHQGLRGHAIEAALAKPHPTDANWEVHSPLFLVYELRLFELADNRLNVTLMCRNPYLLPFHLKMLQVIAKLWPETARAIYNYILLFMPEEERNRLNMVRPGNIDRSVNTIANNFAGTVDYWQNEQGQTIVSGTVNPGYRFEIGEQGISLTIDSSPDTGNQSLSITEVTNHEPKPWEQSRSKDRERDKIIWELRQDNNTWEDIAEQADCGVTTAKEVYKRLLKKVNPG